MTNKVTKTLSDATNKLTARAPVTKPMTKADQLARIAEETGLTRKKVEEVIEELQFIMQDHVKEGVVFTWPGLFKLLVVEKAGTPERSTTNPFTKKPMTIQAKPAYKTVRVKALKKLKNMASDVEISGKGVDLA